MWSQHQQIYILGAPLCHSVEDRPQERWTSGRDSVDMAWQRCDSPGEGDAGLPEAVQDTRVGERKGEAETADMKSDGWMDGLMNSQASEVKAHLLCPLTTESSEQGERCSHPPRPAKMWLLTLATSKVGAAAGSSFSPELWGNLDFPEQNLSCWKRSPYSDKVSKENF